MGEIVGMLFIGGGIMVAITAIISNAVRRTAQSREREQSRRELAAYVAEGSITAEDARKLLEAGKSFSERVDG